MNSKPKTFQVAFQSDLFEMKNVIGKTINFINENKSLNKNDISDLKLVLHELLANAVIHGNKKNKKKNVYMQLKLKDNFITTKIIDEGKGFDYVTHMAKYNEYHLKDSGRGIKLACALTDSVVFNSLGNEIKFLKKVKPNV